MSRRRRKRISRSEALVTSCREWLRFECIRLDWDGAIACFYYAGTLLGEFDPAKRRYRSYVRRAIIGCLGLPAAGHNAVKDKIIYEKKRRGDGRNSDDGDDFMDG